MDRKLMLFTWSDLEKSRIKDPKSDPKDLSLFATLDSMIQHSLRPPTLLQVHTPAGSLLKQPKIIDRPFQDETLLQKLIQYRNQIPLSPRIIRTTNS